MFFSIGSKTKNILFICAGSFAGLEKIIATRGRGTAIGFGADVREKNEENKQNILSTVEPEDIIKFGLIPELVGRLPIVVPLKDLTEEDLVNILSEPKNSIVRQYQKLFSLDKIELEFEKDTLAEIAKKAIVRKTGARGLRAIVESILLDTMFAVPECRNVQKVQISKEVITNNQQPKIIVSSEAEQNKTNIELDVKPSIKINKSKAG